MKQIMDAATMQRTLTRLSYEIIERHKGVENIILVGIKTRGEYLAKRIQQKLEELEGEHVPMVALDVKPYRDDQPHQQISLTASLDVDGRNVVLVDDVFYTGRTTRAAMDAVMESGRAKRISLAVLIDRGHRELPIRADYVGKNIPTSCSEKIKVHMTEIDDEDSVILVDKGEQ